MSVKLDQSLDDIMKSSKAVRGTRRVATKKAKVATPAGGISKKTAVAKTARNGKTTKVNAAVAAAVPIGGDSKIVVSGLPKDVTEDMIKDYFGKTVGNIKRVMLTYGPNGVSRGIATLVFGKGDVAAKAASLNGMKIDSRPIKIEVVQELTSAPKKTLEQRITTAKKDTPKTNGKPAVKAAVKAATKTKATKANGADAAGKPRGRKGKGGRKPKTAEELDAEMTDYFGPTNGAETNGAVQANGGDTGMTDGIM